MNVTKIYHWLSDPFSSTRCCSSRNSCVYFQTARILYATVCSLKSELAVFSSPSNRLHFLKTHIYTQAHTHKQIKHTNLSF